MAARFLHNLGDLERDLIETSRSFRTPAARAVRDVAETGLRTARRLSRQRDGQHGKHYTRAITAERLGPLIFEYGPDASKKQGDMNFEEGPGPQTAPHPSMAQSSDGRAEELEKRLRLVQRGTWRL